MLYGFNNSSIGKICVAKCEEENEQIIIIQGIAMKTCVVFNIIVKKIKLKHPNLTVLPEWKIISTYPRERSELSDVTRTFKNLKISGNIRRKNCMH
jgi:hypothetical protein